MSNIIIAFGTQILVFCFLFLVGKYLLPKVGIDSVSKLDKAISEHDFIANYAANFVAWAKEFMPKASGDEKMGTVVTKLVEIANKFDIDMDRTVLMAIAQNAYNVMKAGLAQSECNKIMSNVADKMPVNNHVLPQEATNNE